MATPALRLLRERLPGSYIGVLVRPGIDEVLAGAPWIDEFHVHRPSGLMSPKFAASKVRPRRYETALLFTNSFSTALITRLAGIPRRIGHARDMRGMLLTDRLEAPWRAEGKWAPVPACVYYLHAARALIDPSLPRQLTWDWQVDVDQSQRALEAVMDGSTMELAISPRDRTSAETLVLRTGTQADQPIAILNPGGNNPAKRWPVERFAALADHLAGTHGLKVLVNGSPAEAELAANIGRLTKKPIGSLPAMGTSLGTVKALVARSRIMITNDTGPRHIAAALGVPVVTLFGPTDHRWTTIPAPAGQINLLADPTLPLSAVADDHPERCRVDRISLEMVCEAADRMLQTPVSKRDSVPA